MSNVDFGGYKRLVQAFWDPEPKNDDPSAAHIWCLGQQYSARKPKNGDSPKARKDLGQVQVLTNGDGGAASENTDERSNGTIQDKVNGQTKQELPDQSWPSDFLDDCESRAWFTYRSSFFPIQKSSEASMTLSVRLRSLGEQGGFTSDTGWGCMIRSGQSLLANALINLRLGRNWRRGEKQHEERQILSLFADDPGSPFSIHRFVEHGALSCGKHPGEWFGPSATARCIQALAEDYDETGLKVYVNGDGADVYEDRFFGLAKSKQGKFTPTLILVQIRLGIDRITPVYWDALRNTLRLPQSVGIAGGRPSSSLYFFGFQGEQFFYLDPHFTRSALPLHQNVDQYTQEEVDSCHTRRIRRISLKDMDPSMLIAFLIRDEDEWKQWRQAVEKPSGKAVIHVADREPSLHGLGSERASAVDDVETFDDDETDIHDNDGELVESTGNA